MINGEPTVTSRQVAEGERTVTKDFIGDFKRRVSSHFECGMGFPIKTPKEEA